MSVPRELRIVSWNINHRAKVRVLHDRLLEAIEQLAPDILCLSEYVDHGSREAFKQGLRSLGFGSIAVSSNVRDENHILVAARLPFERGEIDPPSLSRAAVTNFLHCRFECAEFVGLRVPYYKAAKDHAAYWSLLQRIISSAKDRRIIFMGDLNVNLDNPPKYARAAIAQLTGDGWHIPPTQGEWSYMATTGRRWSKIDHAIVNPLLRVKSSFYSYAIGDLVFAGAKQFGPVSDHAPHTLEVEVHPSST